jgi:hypothetical protein
MKSWRSVVSGGGLLVAAMSVVATTRPIEGLRVPVAFYPDGALKQELTAKQAVVREDGTIDAADVELRLLSPAGAEEVVVRAARATVDRVGQRAQSDSPITVVKGPLTLTGEGYEWNGKPETIRILRNVRLSFPSTMFKEQTGELREVQKQD